MPNIRFIVALIAALLLPAFASGQTSSQSQPTEESKKLPTGSAAERKARMQQRANSQAYTKLSRKGQATVARNGSYLPLSAAAVREQLLKLD
jgi:hypothetical protein